MNPRRASIAAAAALALVAMVGASSVILATGQGAGERLAPDLELTLYQGRGASGGSSVRLSDYRGSPVVVNFWAVWCPPCRVEMPALDEVYRRFKSQGLVVIGVDTGPFDADHDQEALDFLTRVGATFPSGRTELAEAAAQYDLHSIPTTVFIRRDGTIHSKRVGFIDADNLLALAEELVEE